MNTELAELAIVAARLEQAQAEIARLREALSQVNAADSCGCSVYGRIARAALEAKS